MSAKNKPGDDVNDLRQRLDQTLQSASEGGQQIVRKGHEFSAAGQSVSDWAQATRGILPFIDNRSALIQLNESWGRSNQFTQHFAGQLAGISSSTLTSTADVSSVSSVLNIGALWTNFSIDDPRNRDAKVAFERLQNLSERPEVQSIVLGLLKNLRLDESKKGHLSAVEQFEAAYRAFSVNASGGGHASMWLIPMRECILTVLDELLKRRRHSEKVKGSSGKVLSILDRLGRSDLPEGHSEELATQCKILLNSGLSASKQARLTRIDSESTLMAATIWLKGFLSAVDQTEARRPAR